eukprot:scaffold128377_cov14-Tisochrysis_lutea.AAC.1
MEYHCKTFGVKRPTVVGQMKHPQSGSIKEALGGLSSMRVAMWLAFFSFFSLPFSKRPTCTRLEHAAPMAPPTDATAWSRGPSRNASSECPCPASRVKAEVKGEQIWAKEVARKVARARREGSVEEESQARKGDSSCKSARVHERRNVFVTWQGARRLRFESEPGKVTAWQIFCVIIVQHLSGEIMALQSILQGRPGCKSS